MTLCRKGVSAQDAQAAVDDYLRWRVVENSVGLLREGMADRERWQVSFRDALILAAARRAGAGIVYSEDLSDQQDYGSVRVVNPFRLA